MPTHARVVATLLLGLFAAGCARPPDRNPGAAGTPPVATQAALSTTASGEANAKKEPEAKRTLRVLELTGTAYDRGVEHGTGLRLNRTDEVKAKVPGRRATVP